MRNVFTLLVAAQALGKLACSLLRLQPRSSLVFTSGLLTL